MPSIRYACEVAAAFDRYVGAGFVHHNPHFRFEVERIVEPWDVGMPGPEASVNERGLF